MGHPGFEVEPGAFAAATETEESTAEGFYVKSEHIIFLIMMMFWAKGTKLDSYLSTGMNLMFQRELSELAKDLIIINRGEMLGHVNVRTCMGRIIRIRGGNRREVQKEGGREEGGERKGAEGDYPT